MEPLDAAVLQAVDENGGASWIPNGRDYLVTKLKCAQDEVLISFENLLELRCIGFPSGSNINPLMQPMGRILMQAVR
jgi:hypothetical protein